LAPTASTAQATFTWLDERFSGFDPDAVVMPGSNIVGAALVSNQWTGLMPGTNIVGAALVSNQWTGLMPGTNIVGATYVNENGTNQWVASGDYAFFAVNTNGMFPGDCINTTFFDSEWDAELAGAGTNVFNVASGVFVPESNRTYLVSASAVMSMSAPSPPSEKNIVVVLAKNGDYSLSAEAAGYPAGRLTAFDSEALYGADNFRWEGTVLAQFVVCPADVGGGTNFISVAFGFAGGSYSAVVQRAYFCAEEL
jgi:hypothetical protein